MKFIYLLLLVEVATAATYALRDLDGTSLTGGFPAHHDLEAVKGQTRESRGKKKGKRSLLLAEEERWSDMNPEVLDLWHEGNSGEPAAIENGDDLLWPNGASGRKGRSTATRTTTTRKTTTTKRTTTKPRVTTRKTTTKPRVTTTTRRTTTTRGKTTTKPRTTTRRTTTTTKPRTTTRRTTTTTRPRKTRDVMEEW